MSTFNSFIFSFKVYIFGVREEEYMRIKFLILMGGLLLFLCGCELFLEPEVNHISTKEELAYLSDGGNFIIDNDIDCEGYSFKAIENFDGSIQGNGKKIRNVKFISDNNCFGLIGSASNLSVSNLGIENFTIDTNHKSSSNALYIGGIVGYVTKDYQLTSCYTKGNIIVDINNKETYIGGMVGVNEDLGKINSCMSDVSIEAKLNETSISSGNLAAGGLIGESRVYSEINKSLTLGSIEVDTVLNLALGYSVYAGGIIGHADSSIIIKCCLSVFNKIKVSTFMKSNSKIGGIAGRLKKESSESEFNYYCGYDVEGDQEFRNLYCSIFEGKKNDFGNGMILERNKLLQKDFMQGNYSFFDLNQKQQDSFLEFSPDVWNFGEYHGDSFIKPSLKIFN